MVSYNNVFVRPHDGSTETDPPSDENVFQGDIILTESQKTKYIMAMMMAHHLKMPKTMLVDLMESFHMKSPVTTPSSRMLYWMVLK